MEYEKFIPVFVAIIGAFQVAMAIYFARGKNKATTESEKSSATLNIGESYSTLIQRLEDRLSKVEGNYDKLCNEYEKDRASWEAEIARLEAIYDKLSEEYETDKAAWAAERSELQAEITRLETLIEVNKRDSQSL